jgi:hypothetical protein
MKTFVKMTSVYSTVGPNKNYEYLVLDVQHGAPSTVSISVSFICLIYRTVLYILYKLLACVPSEYRFYFFFFFFFSYKAKVIVLMSGRDDKSDDYSVWRRRGC